MKTCLIVLLGLLSTRALAQQGQWEEWFPFGAPFDPTAPLLPIAPVHLIHLHTGEVVAITLVYYPTPPATPDPCEPSCPEACVGKSYLWTPPPPDSPGNPGQFQNIPNCRNFLFCCGHSALADGRILTIGGHWSATQKYTDLYDPALPLDPVLRWNFPIPPGDMAKGRWYPTGTTLADGKVLATSGTEGPPVQGLPPPPWVIIPELFDPAAPTQSAWTPLPSATRQQVYYPWMFLLPDGNLVDAGHGESRILISSPTWTWGSQPLGIAPWLPTPPTPPGHAGSAVMHEPGKIMKCGGGDPTVPGELGVASTFVVDLNGADPNAPPPWIPAGNMNIARIHHNLAILPDGKVLAVGGAKYWDDDPLPNPVPPCSTPLSLNVCPVLQPEIYDPQSGNWTLQESAHTHPRMYHSTLILLRDGRVLSAGGDTQRNAQFFKPPYLVAPPGSPPGNPPPPRPIITSAPTVVIYGQQYTIGYNANGGPAPTRVCLIRLGSVTHGFDQDQRRVPLSILVDGTNSLTVLAPANGNIAPPGYYMLFILNEYQRNQYAPSVATYVRVGPGP